MTKLKKLSTWIKKNPIKSGIILGLVVLGKFFPELWLLIGV